MLSTNAVLTAAASADDLIDKMELATDVFNKAEQEFLAAYQTAAASGTRHSDDIRMIDLLKKYFMMKGHGKLADADAVMTVLIAADGVIDKLELATGQLNLGERDQLARIQSAGGSAGWKPDEIDFFMSAFARYIDQGKAQNL